MDLDGKGRDYDLQTQGTSVKSIIDYPVSIIENKSTTPLTHRVFGRNSGLTRYIGDGTSSDAVITNKQGYATSQLQPNDEANFWILHKIKADGDNYFGVSPDVRTGDGMFTTLYAGFPFSLASNGMKAYYVSMTGNGMAALKEITGTVPLGTPVIIKCAGETASDNRLEIGGDAAAIDGNMLGGVYFENTSLRHKNLTPYDKETMRVLGTLSDGSLGFVVGNYEYLPRNKAYLSVPAGSPAEIKLVSEEEYVNASIDSVISDATSVRIEGMTLYADGNSRIEIYNVTGQLVGSGCLSSFTLPAPGVYIVRSGASTVKLIAR